MVDINPELLKIRDPVTGKFKGLPAIRGESAYEAAVRLGYFSGTEAEFVEAIANAGDTLQRAEKAASDAEASVTVATESAATAKQNADISTDAVTATKANADAALESKNTAVEKAGEAVDAAGRAEQAEANVAELHEETVTAAGNAVQSAQAAEQSAQSSKEAADHIDEALTGKQDKITDLETIRSGAAAGATALQEVPDTYRKATDQDEIDSAISQRIDAIESAKFPNAVFVGEPLIVGSNVSRFTTSDYMVFPFVVDVRGKQFSIEFTFRTGADVTAQQNILDSRFGLALAVMNGRGIMALSSNGVSWDIGQATGTHAIEPNSVYHAKIRWDGATYIGELSEDGATYVQDMVLASSAGLHPETMYIGGAPDLFGPQSAHPFGGGVDMGASKLIVAGLEVWHGMDDPGLVSRANVSLSNLDAMGEERFNELKRDLNQKQDAISDLDAIRSGAASGATALQTVPDIYALKTDLAKVWYGTQAEYDSITIKDPDTDYNICED